MNSTSRQGVGTGWGVNSVTQGTRPPSSALWRAGSSLIPKSTSEEVEYVEQ